MSEYINDCANFHGPNHGDRIEALYHDCDVHHDHYGADYLCPYWCGAYDIRYDPALDINGLGCDADGHPLTRKVGK